MVGTDAYAMEKGLVRLEVYQVIGESALIIHETFETNEELQFHLTKGTAAKYKKEIDEVAFPENYFFRGPVSWMIRTYSKFMHLPATYTRIGHQYFNENGSYSDGLININQNKREMKNQEITVVYQWHANEGKSEDLKRIYELVEKDMQETEPGALKVNCFFDESKNTLVVEDLFADAAALGQHLGTTAAKHFPSLLQIANPGQFLFCGFVPEEMQQAAIGMGLDAKFATKINGFERVSAEV
jgi:quinol monooxygenase YgiN